MVLDILIAPNGDVIDVKVVQSVDDDLNDAAVEAVRQWKYEPGAAQVEIKVRVEFPPELTSAER